MYGPTLLLALTLTTATEGAAPSTGTPPAAATAPAPAPTTAPPAPASPSGAPDARALLRDADRARGGLEDGITWTIELESSEEGTVTRRSFLVKARGKDALVESTAPARFKGEVMLLNDRAMWFVKPGLKKPVSISSRQRLVGEAANGDVASTNYARDYDGVIAGEETLDGEACWRLDLVAKGSDVTYERIRYWVAKRRHLGLKAEFLTVSGDVFKTAVFAYGNRVRLGAASYDFVSRMSIRDAFGAGNVTVLNFIAPRSERHPESLFNINNVVR